MSFEIPPPAAMPNEFRRAIRHLRSGVTSPSAARMITVGTNAVESELNKYEIGWLSGTSASNMVFILGDWGFGKTHLRMLLLDSLLGRRVPFVHDHVDGKSGSLAHLHRTVPRWMESLQLGPYTGIRALIEQGLNDFPKVRSWCREHNTSFARDLNCAMNGREWAWNLVAGHQYHFPDYSSHHLKALEILVDSAALLAAFSRGGIVLLLDEAENVSRQHDVRGRRKTYDTLGRLADDRNIFTLLFITDRFFDQVENDRHRGLREGWTMWTPTARRFLTTVGSVPVAKPPRLNSYLAKALVQKIADVYLHAFQCNVRAAFIKDVINAWDQTAMKSARLLVRIAIDALDRTIQ
jgi:hypothetical protein